MNCVFIFITVAFQQSVKAFFDNVKPIRFCLNIAAFMAASSLGRRSWYHSPSGKIQAAALISQSRRIVNWAWGNTAERRLFFFLPSPGS